MLRGDVGMTVAGDVGGGGSVRHVGGGGGGGHDIGLRAPINQIRMGTK